MIVWIWSQLQQSKKNWFCYSKYIGTNVDQVIGKVYVQQARGKNEWTLKDFTNTKRPMDSMNKEDIELKLKQMKEIENFLYAKKIGIF